MRDGKDADNEEAFMEIVIEVGVRGQETLTVRPEDTAVHYGSGLVEVLATPAMIGLMEKTCLNSVLPFLPAGFGTVGVKVDVSYSRATPVGGKVICSSLLVEADRRRLVFDVLAEDDQGEIGRGRHERFIIDIARFMSRL
jgi:predicted thioesterase